MIQETFMKIFMGMVINSISTEEIIAFVDKFKVDIREKVKETPGVLDDMVVNAFLSSEEDILEGLKILLTFADNHVSASTTTKDDIIWLPISQKLREVIKLMRQRA